MSILFLVPIIIISAAGLMATKARAKSVTAPDLPSPEDQSVNASVVKQDSLRPDSLSKEQLLTNTLQKEYADISPAPDMGEPVSADLIFPDKQSLIQEMITKKEEEERDEALKEMKEELADLNKADPDKYSVLDADGNSVTFRPTLN